jgi:hypothetical protein
VFLGLGLAFDRFKDVTMNGWVAPTIGLGSVMFAFVVSGAAGTGIADIVRVQLDVSSDRLWIWNHDEECRAVRFPGHADERYWTYGREPYTRAGCSCEHRRGVPRKWLDEPEDEL